MNRASSSTGWVRNPDGSFGWTWNPITGCLNHINGMCKGGNFPCYAYRLAHGRLKERYLANDNLARSAYPIPRNLNELPSDEDDPFYPRFWPERCLELDYTMKSKHFTVGGASKVQSKGIFVCDMSDLFGIGIPEGWQESIMNVIQMNHSYRFYLLTKQPQNLIKFSPFPDNCWVGVTATDRVMFNKAAGSLAQIEAKVKYISFEPLLDSVDKNIAGASYLSMLFKEGWLDWLIIGALTGSLEDIKKANYAHRDIEGLMPMPYGNKWTLQPRIEWVQEIIEAADKAGVKVFLKDNLRPLIDANCPDESELVPNHNPLFRMKHPNLCIPCEGKHCYACGVIWDLRQEFPNGA